MAIAGSDQLHMPSWGENNIEVLDIIYIYIYIGIIYNKFIFI